MYSGSSSYLGGGASARPGQQPLPQQQSFQGQQQVFSGGYGGQTPLQQNYTGFPGSGGLQSQATGFPMQQPQFQPPSLPPQQQQQSQFTGFQQPQPTGFQQQQQTGFPGQQMGVPHQQPQPSRLSPQPQIPQPVPQATGYQQQLQPQPTGFQPQSQFGQQQQQQNLQNMQNMQNPQATGYGGPRPPMPPMPSSFNSSQGLSPQPTGFPGQMAAPLNAQPTGRPGQWGLVNAPASGLPNLQALKQQMMPQPGRESGFSAQGLTGNAPVPWAVTKDEKKIYDDMFKAWDGLGKGYITGNQAIEIFGQSGLEKADLERVWTLSDPHNKGRLNLDEFSVAMHLIYRRLNGYPVPNQLPPELIPPSTRNLNDSICTMKGLLSQDAQERKSTGAFLQPQRTGVSYLKSHSFRASGAPASSGRKDATVFKNNDDEVGYRSSARRRVGDGGRSPSPATSDGTSGKGDEPSIAQLRKTIREKQVLLDAMDFEDESKTSEDDARNRRDQKESEDLFRLIRKIQEDIDTHPKAGSRTDDADAERRGMQRQLQGLQDKLPQLASHVRKCDHAIADAQLELFRLKDAKANPGSAAAIIGTGPDGAITESDRLKARAKTMMVSAPQTSGSSYSSYKTAEERAAFIKQQAEQRMAERLAALGIKAPTKGGENAAQRAEREKKEKEDRLKKAEEDDARRERERQSRLQGESVAPPAPASTGKPKPPPPAPRKMRSESFRSEHSHTEAKEQSLKEQQDAMATETKEMQNEEARQERELKRQQEDAKANLKALEEQVKAGKLKKAEEKKKREAAKKEAAEKEAKLAAQKREIVAAKEREAALRKQLESLDDEDSSDEDEAAPQQVKQPSPPSPPPPPPMPEVKSPAHEPPSTMVSPPEQSNNPFFRSMSQPQQPTPPAVGADTLERKDTNPFHRLPQQEPAKQQALSTPSAAHTRTRGRPDEDDDDWSADDSSGNEDDDDDQPQGGSAKQLASILFGTMAPPRPLSSMDREDSKPSSPAPASAGVFSPPPPPPPMPPSGAAPPPPPPMPDSSAPSAPPPPPPPPGAAAQGAGKTEPAAPPPPPGAGDRNGLLQQIQSGKGLRKTQTKDRSQASVAGKVL